MKLILLLLTSLCYNSVHPQNTPHVEHVYSKSTYNPDTRSAIPTEVARIYYSDNTTENASSFQYGAHLQAAPSPYDSFSERLREEGIRSAMLHHVLHNRDLNEQYHVLTQFKEQQTHIMQTVLTCQDYDVITKQLAINNLSFSLNCGDPALTDQVNAYLNECLQDLVATVQNILYDKKTGQFIGAYSNNQKTKIAYSIGWYLLRTDRSNSMSTLRKLADQGLIGFKQVYKEALDGDFSRWPLTRIAPLTEKIHSNNHNQELIRYYNLYKAGNEIAAQEIYNSYLQKYEKVKKQWFGKKNNPVTIQLKNLNYLTETLEKNKQKTNIAPDTQNHFLSLTYKDHFLTVDLNEIKKKLINNTHPIAKQILNKINNINQLSLAETENLITYITSRVSNNHDSKEIQNLYDQLYDERGILRCINYSQYTFKEISIPSSIGRANNLEKQILLNKLILRTGSDEQTYTVISHALHYVASSLQEDSLAQDYFTLAQEIYNAQTPGLYQLLTECGNLATLKTTGEQNIIKENLVPVIATITTKLNNNDLTTQNRDYAQLALLNCSHITKLIQQEQFDQAAAGFIDVIAPLLQDIPEFNYLQDLATITLEEVDIYALNQQVAEFEIRRCVQHQKEDIRSFLKNYSLPDTYYIVLDKHTNFRIKNERIRYFKNILLGKYDFSESTYALNDSAKKLLHSQKVQSAGLQTCYGTDIQQAIHSELVQIANSIGTQKDKKNCHGKSIIRIMPQWLEIARKFNQAGHVVESTEIADFCWALSDCVNILNSQNYSQEQLQERLEHTGSLLGVIISRTLNLKSSVLLDAKKTSSDLLKVIANFQILLDELTELEKSFVLSRQPHEATYDNYFNGILSAVDYELNQREIVRNVARIFKKAESQGIKLYNTHQENIPASDENAFVIIAQKATYQMQQAPGTYYTNAISKTIQRHFRKNFVDKTFLQPHYSSESSKKNELILLTKSGAEFVESCDINAQKFQLFKGTDAQMELHKELTAIANKAIVPKAKTKSESQVINIGKLAFKEAHDLTTKTQLEMELESDIIAARKMMEITKNILCKTWGTLKKRVKDPVGFAKDFGNGLLSLGYVLGDLMIADERSIWEQQKNYQKYANAAIYAYDYACQMSAAEWQAAFEDLAAQGLADTVTFGAIARSIKTVGKVRTMLKERNLAKKSLQLTKLVREEGSAVRATAIIEQESRAEKMRNLFSRAIDRIKNPHTEVVTPEGMVVKVPKEGNLHLMESGSKSGSTTKKTWRTIKESSNKSNAKIYTPQGEVVEVPVKAKEQIRGKIKVTEDFTIKTALPEKIRNELKTFKTKPFKIREHIFKLTKDDMKHILERHHLDFWNGSFATEQTFLNKNFSIKEITNAIYDIMKQNREIIIKNGSNMEYQIMGSYKGKNYIVGFMENGIIGQFYAKR